MEIKKIFQSDSNIAIIVLGTLTFSIIAYAVIIFQLIELPSDRGLFGDMFGALNVLFSAFAFTAAFITLRTQMKEIKNTQRQTERSNTISALQSFIGSHKEEEDIDAVEIAKSILNQVTLEIFTDPEYEDLLTPKLLIRQSLKNTKIDVNEISKESMYSTFLRFTYNGPQCECKFIFNSKTKIRSEPYTIEKYNISTPIRNETLILKNNINYEIKFTGYFEEIKKFDFEILLRTITLNDKWEQNCNIQYQDEMVRITYGNLLRKV